jgi:hypothetical protein
MVATPIQWWRVLFARRKAYLSNDEPSLDELLNEPIIRLMMDRDGVKPRNLRAAFSEMSGRVAEREAVGATKPRQAAGRPPE